jgi:hypothetical protein
MLLAGPITAFLIPRGFVGDVATRQLNALRALLAQGIDVLLLGDDEGVAAAAEREGVRHASIATNEQGTPLVSDAFRRTAELAATPLILYANADVIFLPGLPEAAGRIRRDRFLAVGRRVDLTIEEEVDFRPGWEEALAEDARRRGRPHSPLGLDWFMLPRTLDLGFPPFAVGRPWWDNWTVARARQLRIPVVDLTSAVMVIHQEHGFEHVGGGRPSRRGGPEGEANRALAAGVEPLGILDATHVLGRSGLRPALAPRYLRRRLARLCDRYRRS